MGCQQSVEEESPSSTAPVSPTPETIEDKVAVSSLQEETKESVELLNNALNGGPPTSTVSRPSSSSSQSKDRTASARSRNSVRSNRSAKTPDFVEPSLPGAIPGTDQEEHLKEKVDKETGEEIVNTSRTNSSMSNSMPNGELDRLKKVSERPCTPSPASATSIERKLSGKSMNGDISLLALDQNSKDNISTEAQTQLERQQSVGSLAKLRTAADELPKISEDEELNTALSQEQTVEGGIVITLNSDEQSCTKSNVDDSITRKSISPAKTTYEDQSIETKPEEANSRDNKETASAKKVKFDEAKLESQNNDSIILNETVDPVVAPNSAQLKSSDFEEFDQLAEDENKSTDNQKIEEADNTPIQNEINFPGSNVSKLPPLSPQARDNSDEIESSNRDSGSPEPTTISFPVGVPNPRDDDNTINDESGLGKSQWKAEELTMELEDSIADDETPCSLAASSSGLVLPRPMTSYKKVSQHRALTPDNDATETPSSSKDNSTTDKPNAEEITEEQSTNDGEESNLKQNEKLETNLSHIDESTSPPDLSADVIVSLSGSASKYRVTEGEETKSKDAVEICPSPSHSNKEERIEIQPENIQNSSEKSDDDIPTNEISKKETLSEEEKQNDETNNSSSVPKEEEAASKTDGFDKAASVGEENASGSAKEDNPIEAKEIKSVKELDLQEVGRLLSREISSASQNGHIEDNDIASVKAEVLGF